MVQNCFLKRLDAKHKKGGAKKYFQNFLCVKVMILCHWKRKFATISAACPFKQAVYSYRHTVSKSKTINRTAVSRHFKKHIELIVTLYLAQCHFLGKQDDK